MRKVVIILTLVAISLGIFIFIQPDNQSITGNVIDSEGVIYDNVVYLGDPTIVNFPNSVPFGFKENTRRFFGDFNGDGELDVAAYINEVIASPNIFDDWQAVYSHNWYIMDWRGNMLSGEGGISMVLEATGAALY